MNNDLEPQAAARVGQLVFAFARLDFLLAMAIRNLLASSGPENLNPLIERLGFKERLDSLRELVLCGARSLTREAIDEFESWYPRADNLRTTRNAFVHGRWGVQTRETVFNASTKIGRTFIGEAKIFSLSQLDEEVESSHSVLSQFHEWHFRHVLNAV